MVQLEEDREQHSFNSQSCELAIWNYAAIITHAYNTMIKYTLHLLQFFTVLEEQLKQQLKS